MGSKANACAPLKWKKAERLQSWGHRRGRAVGRCPWFCWLFWGVVKYDVATPSGATNMHPHNQTRLTHTFSLSLIIFFLFLFLFFWGLARTHSTHGAIGASGACVSIGPTPRTPTPTATASFRAFWQAWLASPRRFQKLKAAQIQGWGTGCGADQNKNLKRNNFGVKIAENIDGGGYSHKDEINEV